MGPHESDHFGVSVSQRNLPVLLLFGVVGSFGLLQTLLRLVLFCLSGWLEEVSPNSLYPGIEYFEVVSIEMPRPSGYLGRVLHLVLHVLRQSLAHFSAQRLIVDLFYPVETLGRTARVESEWPESGVYRFIGHEVHTGHGESLASKHPLGMSF